MNLKTIYSFGLSLMLILMSINTFAGQSRGTNASKKQAPVTYITGHLQSKNLRDTMILEILKEFGSSANAFSVDRKLMQVTKAGNFKFALPSMERPVYFNLQTPFIKGLHYLDWKNHLLDGYMLMPGDSVHIEYLDAEKRVVFSGKSEAQCSWIYETGRLLNQKIGTLLKVSLPQNPEQWLANQDTILNFVLNRLPLLKNKVKTGTYTIMKADVIGKYLGNTYLNLSFTDIGAAYKDSALTNRSINVYHSKLFKQVADTTASELLISSRFYASYLLNKTRTEYKYKRLTGLPHPADFFSELKSVYPSGILKEKMIMAYLYERIAGSAITDRLINEALAIIHIPRYREMLLEMKEIHGKGSVVESTYVFNDKLDRPVRLSDYKGKVIFVDMWFTGCFGCIAVAKSLPQVEKEFHNNPDVIFISLSIDKDKAKWLRSIDGSKKAMNANKTIAYTHYTTDDTKYLYTGGVGGDHPFIKKYNPTGTYPHLLLIDKEGRIFTSDVPTPVDEERNEKLINLIRDALSQR